MYLVRTTSPSNSPSQMDNLEGFAMQEALAMLYSAENAVERSLEIIRNQMNDKEDAPSLPRKPLEEERPRKTPKAPQKALVKKMDKSTRKGDKKRNSHFDLIRWEDKILIKFMNLLENKNNLLSHYAPKLSTTEVMILRYILTSLKKSCSDTQQTEILNVLTELYQIKKKRHLLPSRSALNIAPDKRGSESKAKGGSTKAAPRASAEKRAKSNNDSATKKKSRRD
jgi:hypothetical protein